MNKIAETILDSMLDWNSDLPLEKSHRHRKTVTLEERRTGQGGFPPPGDATRRMGAVDVSPHIIKEVILVVSIQAIKRRTTYGR